MKDLSSLDHDKPSAFAQRATADKVGLSLHPSSFASSPARQRNTRNQQRSCQIRQQQQ